MSRDGSDYLIEGEHLLNFEFDEEPFPVPSITACGEDCIFTDWKSDSYVTACNRFSDSPRLHALFHLAFRIQCSTRKSNFFQSARCNELMIRGKVKGSYHAFLARTDRQMVDNYSLSLFPERKILDRYYVSRN